MSAYTQIPDSRPDTIDELLELYKPVVNYWVSRCRPSVMRGYEDYRQDALMNLVIAFHNFEPDRGATFKTYAVNMVKWAVQNLINYGRSIHSAVSSKNWEKFDFLTRPTYLEDLRFGTDKHYGQGKETKVFLDEDSDKPFDLADISFEHLCSLIEDQRLRYIIEQRYLHDRTLEDLSREFGVTREYVRQLQEKAHGIIRRWLTARKFLVKSQVIETFERPRKQPPSLQPVPRPVPCMVTVNTNMVRLAEIALVSKRTAYRWVDKYGKEVLVNKCNEMLANYQNVVTPSDLVKKLKVSKSTIYRWINEGKLTALMFFDTIRIPLTEVDRLYREARSKCEGDPVPLSSREAKLLLDDNNAP